jgi:hypothetical protein
MLAALHRRAVILLNASRLISSSTRLRVAPRRSPSALLDDLRHVWPTAQPVGPHAGRQLGKIGGDSGARVNPSKK